MKPHFRYTPEPVLEPVPGCEWASKMVLNPAIVKDPASDRLHMLFRATGPWSRKRKEGKHDPYPIFLGYAASSDLGRTWTADFSRPAIAPALNERYEDIYITDIHGNHIARWRLPYSRKEPGTETVDLPRYGGKVGGFHERPGNPPSAGEV